ncbi:MAG: hypothetical protein HGA45_19465 [Chloroflexales bacterium]|nr:hypothetical protein [Chloroflexales bacterium]
MSGVPQTVQRLLEAMQMVGRRQAWELLASDLQAALCAVPPAQRPAVGRQWLRAVGAGLRAAGEPAPSHILARALLLGAGTALDRTLLLPTGCQQIRWN